MIIFFTFLLSCGSEYGIGKKGNTPGVIVDSAERDTGSPPLIVDPPVTDIEPDPFAQILIEPYDYDFGEVDVNCEYEYDVVVSSVGTGPLVIDEVTYDSTPELSLATEYVFPMTIEPGDSVTFTFEFNEVDLIQDSGRMFIYSNALGKTMQMVTNMGIGKASGSHTDTYKQEEISKSDILFVVDNSCSMAEEQESLAAEAEDFIDTLMSKGTDFQIAIITTDSWVDVVGLITPLSSDPVGEFAAGVLVGTGGSAFEKGQEYAMQALDLGSLSKSRYGREDAALSVVVVSDEDDQSPLTEIEYNDYFLTIKDPDLFFFHSITGTDLLCASTEIGLRYISQSVMTGGNVLDICGSWGNNLSTLANSNYIIQEVYPLTKTAAPGTVEVFLDGVPLSTGWYYDNGPNSVILEDKSLVTGPEIFQIMYDYIDDCPH
tara:strand:+ start:3799 stop:5091 length:1293 start_codon:yes stop_codon:yes gene_type:complete